MANRTVTVKSSGGDYTTLNAAFAGEDDTYADLVTNTMILTFDCYNFEDTTVANTGTAWTVSSSYYLNITSNVAHGGKYSTSAYRLAVEWAAAIFIITEEYSRINGLQVYAKGTGEYNSSAVNIEANNIKINSCIVRGSNTDRTYSSTRGLYPTGSLTGIEITNSLFYDFSDAGDIGIFLAYCTASVLNCTAVNCTTGFNTESSNNTVKNSLTVDCANGFAGSWNAASNYNASDIESDAPGAQSVDLSAYADTDIFVDPANDDFHLKAGSPCINVGVDLSATFTTDIDGQTRPTGAGTWDIGADEYVATVVFLAHILLKQYKARRD